VAVGCLFHLTLVAFPTVFAGFAFSFSGTVGLLVTLALMRFVSETSRAFGFQVLGFAAESVISRLILLAALLLLLGIGIRLDASVALQLYVVAQAATVAIVIGWMLTRLRPGGDARRPRPMRLYRAWLATASVMLVTPVFYFLLFETDVMALGILAGPYEVGVYQVARRLAELTVFCSSAVSAVSLPRLARAHAERDSARLQSMTDIMNLMAVTSTLVVAAALILLGPWGLWIFGPEFDAGYPALVVLALGRVLTVMTGPGSDLLLMTGHHRLLGRVNLWFGLANVALNVVLVPTFGVLGAAIATALASGGWSLWLYAVVRRVSPIEPCVLLRLWRGFQTMRVERQG
jgi:O-antigen/teichoic acid export membrane protein